MMKDIKGYEGIYAITDDGRVYSYRKDRFLKPHMNNNGYHQTDLCVNQKHYYPKVHRLVAEAFIPNPNNYPLVNHKDENRMNNNVDNLEWTTYKYNTNYSNVGYRANLPRWKKVIQLDKEGNVIKEFPCVAQVERELGFSHSNIVNCCNKPDKFKTAYGYKWKYSEVEE